VSILSFYVYVLNLSGEIRDIRCVILCRKTENPGQLFRILERLYAHKNTREEIENDLF